MKRTTLGIMVILLGVALLLANFNVYNMAQVLDTWWPAFLIVLAVMMAFGNRKKLFWPLVLFMIGGVLLLRNLNIMIVDIGMLIVPGLIIIAGIALFRRGTRKPQAAIDKTRDDITVVLSGVEHKNESKEYTGGSLTAILGGGEIDLSDVTIKDEAHISVLTFMGGFELRVPKNVEVVNRTTAIFGGVENKSNASTGKKRSVLYIDGYVALGGIEIKR